MKTTKLIPFTAVIIIIFLLIFLLQFLNTDDSKAIKNQEGISETSSSTNDSVNGKIQNEILDLQKIESDKSLPSDSNLFSTEVIARNFEDGRIDFEINIYKPQIAMNQVVVSAYLGEKILNHLNTPHPLVTNILAVHNPEGEDIKEIFNIAPNSKIKGVSASSNMIYFDGETFENVLQSVPYIFIKVSWTEEDGSEKVEYVKYPNERITIKDEKNSVL